MNRYEGKVAIVTASAAGIGKAIVERLIAEGAQVLATSRNGADELAEAMGERCVSMKVDIADEAQIEAMVNFAMERFGRIDAVFNVANGSTLGTILGTTSDEWRKTFDISVMGTFNCTRLAARAMIKAGIKGSIVNVSSLNADVPARGLSSYSCGKAAIVMLAKACAIEMAEYGIRVNTLSPGLTGTPVNQNIPEAMFGAFMDRIPVGRMGTPEEQAEAALFLGSDQSSYMFGANLVVDGGWSHSGYPDTRLWFGPYLDDRLG